MAESKYFCPLCGEKMERHETTVAGVEVVVEKCSCGYVCDDESKIG